MRLIASVALAVLLGACETPPRTTQLETIRAPDRYGWPGDDNESREDTLFVVTASGGGTRAAALTLGTLRALNEVRLSTADRTLLGEVDIISSVSGGSVTAAYYALAGPEGFDKLERDFIRRDGISQLVLRLVNPVNVAELLTDSRSRLDVLIDYLEDTLFDDKTYARLVEQRRRPYLILNAADMSEGAVFSFTQPQFDLICADLVKFKLSEAVAASAAFPVALAPLTIKSYAPCNAQWAKYEERTGSGLKRRWPPLWIQNALATDMDLNANRTRRGRLAQAYLNMNCDYETQPPTCRAAPDNERKAWVHLLDGGIADNLGLNEPLRLVTTIDAQIKDSRGFLTQIFDGDIRNLVFVIVNARSEADTNLDRSGSTPGIFKMLSATTGSAIDAATFGMQDRLARTVKELIQLRAQATALPKFINNAKQLNSYVVPVDFDYIENPACRRFFKNIATSWTLEGHEIDALQSMAGALVRRSRHFQNLLTVYGAPPPDGPTVDAVCETVVARQNPVRRSNTG
ncbi:MAG: patatin-like phospholipase family protein [Alphaproteobacteria bacterium]|nr:patatin-like phospholipase family protein [Alphaproteobacteria bacterium]